MRVTKQMRNRIYKMFDGRCAYCGKKLKKGWHVDHKKPLFRGYSPKPEWAGEDVEENMVPSCPRCNLRKSSLTVEEFRSEILAQPRRLFDNNNGYRLAMDYGIIQALSPSVIFYFERWEA